MTNVDIKTIIKNHRIEAGLTMKELADLVGVSEATVSRWESGNIATMKHSQIANLCKALHISPALIVPGIEYSEHDKSDSSPSLDNTVQNKNIDSKDIINTLHQDGVMLDGRPLSPDEAERLRESIQLAIRQAKKTQGNKD